MKQVVAYIRVSTDGQVGEDKFGLESQRKQIVEYCEKNEMEIVKWFCDEGESGAKERAGFDEIIYGEVENPPYEAVVVAKSDRVARDIELYYYYKMMLRKKDIELISVTEDFGRDGMFSGILEMFTVLVAKMERENINKRTSGGRKIKAARGGYAGGKAPMGYRVEKGCLVIDEEEAKVVRRIHELRDSGVVLLKIVDIINAEGYRGRKGNEFKLSTVQGIVNNRKTYEGYYKYGEDAEWVKGQHEAILK